MNSLRWKLILVSFVLVFVPMYVLNQYAIRSFDRFTSRALEEEMISQAMILGEQYKGFVAGRDPEGGGEERFAEIIDHIGSNLQSRLQIVSPLGIVLFDSASEPAVGANVSGLKEISRAMQGRYGSRWEKTADGKFVFYYVALPIRADERVVAIACNTRHTGQITRAIREMIHDQRVALFCALAAAALISAVLGQTMTRRLRRLTRAVSDYAQGQQDVEVPARGRDEIGELGRAFNLMSAEIDKRQRYNRDFVSTVMHELKTPLTAIRGAAEVLEGDGGRDAAAREKFLSNIRFETNRMIRMVGELTELTRLDAEVPRAEKERVAYGEFVKGVLDRLEPSFEQPHAAIECDVPETPVYVRVVPGRIEQVICNLLENALRYTGPEGTVSVGVRLVEGGGVETTVRDNGAGITASNIDRVFDRFFTTEPKGVPMDYGTGLGLAIAKSIVENHQGAIRVESAEGQGASFSFSLPVVG